MCIWIILYMIPAVYLFSSQFSLISLSLSEVRPQFYVQLGPIPRRILFYIVYTRGLIEGLMVLNANIIPRENFFSGGIF
jgi:hypothetical protein